jgi:RNA-directed DNA polymerase
MDLITRLVEEFPFSEREVIELLQSAPARYKVHTIKKRNGRGTREIAQPTLEVKIIQRWALSEYVERLPVHEAAMAYRRGLGIKNHAEKHAANNYLLKLDFKDFFPSIRLRDLVAHFNIFSDIPPNEIAQLARLFCWYRKPAGHLRLSIGAPSSPALSNTVMYCFDKAISTYCHELDITYTRYADDLAFSTNKPKTLDRIHQLVQKTCREMPYPRLTLNTKKTVFTSKKRERQLTGIILANSGLISLGREKKREIRAMAHRYSLGKLDAESIQRLRGLLAFAHSIEPGFLDSISRMISDDQLQTLIRRQPNKISLDNSR